MPKKKKEIPMPEIKKNNIKLIGKYYIIAMVVLSAIIGTALWLKSHPNPEYVQKNVINNYVCKIVGADAESDMIAVECLTK